MPLFGRAVASKPSTIAPNLVGSSTGTWRGPRIRRRWAKAGAVRDVGHRPNGTGGGSEPRWVPRAEMVTARAALGSVAARGAVAASAGRGAIAATAGSIGKAGRRATVCVGRGAACGSAARRISV